MAAQINTLIERAEAANKTLAFHPIYSDFQKYDGKPLFEVLLAYCSDKLQVCLDVYHVAKAGNDPVDWIKKLKGRMPLVHFKDMAFHEGKEVLVPVGQGVLDWDRIIGACIEASVAYCFAEQETSQKDPFVCLGESYDFIVSQIHTLSKTA